MLKIGIVGLPNVGKSTLFKALTKQSVDISNYPFCTINPNIGIVKVPDQRLEKIAEKFPRPNIIPAAIEFIDIAGLVKGASQGHGLGNKFLSHIREVDAIVEIVRVFENENISHINERVDPVRDIEILETELMLSDLETVNYRIEKSEKRVKSGSEDSIREYEVLKKLKNGFLIGKKASDLNLEEEEIELVKDLFLLTLKPIIYLYNYSDKIPELVDELKNKKYILLDAKIELELSEMDKNEIQDLEMEPKIFDLIKESYKALNLITFFTMNEREIRAWEIKKGTKAPQAGGKIHGDFEKKFIKAEAISWDKLINVGSWQKAREKGLLEIMGKESEIKDGSVVYFLI